MALREEHRRPATGTVAAVPAANVEHFAAIPENSPYAILMLNPGGRIAYMNPSAQDLFGADRAGLEAILVVSERHRADLEDAIRYHVEHEFERGATLELAALRPDGSEFP